MDVTINQLLVVTTKKGLIQEFFMCITGLVIRFKKGKNKNNLLPI